jgi:uncharacterized membrane protein
VAEAIQNYRHPGDKSMEAIASIGSALHREDLRSEDLERWASLATATAVMAFGSSRRSVSGVCLALAATPLAYVQHVPRETGRLHQGRHETGRARVFADTTVSPTGLNKE